MKSVHFKKGNDEKEPKKNKTQKHEKKIVSQMEMEMKKYSDVSKSENCEWMPSRDWHRYLSGNEENVNNPKENGQQNELNQKHLTWGDCASIDDQNSKNYEDLMLIKPPDKLVDIKLPAVNFCSEEKRASQRVEQNPNLLDLGGGDRGRIAHLVQELARCKQEKQDDEETILMLKNKVWELKASLRKLISQRNTQESKAISKIQSQNEVEQIALRNQLGELNQLIYQLQVQKATTEVQLRTIAQQAERMTKVIHEMHRENTELQVELRITKERLSVAQNAVDKVTKDLQECQHNMNMKPVTVDRACQSAEDLGTGNMHMYHHETTHSNSVPDDQLILRELFFNKSLENDFAPKETVIILPSDSMQLLTKN